MRKTKEQNRGITLIALVITIIVMLILVAVTISMAVNGGLFNYAGKSVGDTKNSIKAEQTLADGRIKVDGKWYDSITDYVAGKELENQNEVNGGNVETESGGAEENGSGSGGTTGGDGTGSGYGSGTGTGTAVTASSMQSDLRQYLGQPVNYGVSYGNDNSLNDWEIFFADEEHIYIITKSKAMSIRFSRDHVYDYSGTVDFTPNNLGSIFPSVLAGLLNKTYNPLASGSDDDPFVKTSIDEYNMRMTEYVLDSTKWSSFTNDFADWAIGSPTLELFVNSFNTYYPEKAVQLEVPTSDGYTTPIPDADYIPRKCVSKPL